MIIMINGAFGVGKTTVSEELSKKIPNSFIFDPEMVGFMLNHMLPSELKKRESPSGDFQDFLLWKNLVVKTAEGLVETYGYHLIVPMTIRKPDYFEYIRSGFQKVSETHHYCLTATKETIFNRLRERGEDKGNWCFKQTQRCLDAYETYDFSTYIDTNGSQVEQVVEQILQQIHFTTEV
ncbi:AAA family ATPase [Halobacillus locisalis]|uniref:AAA family ATPase n=1 Tax=Halobacillus locisalis TaxID=220753 RepID=A0A838CQ54_9BACI|nr:AAA family ATPase [Halobacillus locisalis]MBA2173766.1 AAA family ATPase [Halobacillus locisalis]